MSEPGRGAAAAGPAAAAVPSAARQGNQAPDRVATPPAAGKGAPWSLERRLRQGLLGSLMTLWLLGSAAGLLGLWHEVSEVLDSALAETAQRLLVLPEAALVDRPGEQQPAGIAPHEEFVLYQVLDGQGRVRLRSHQAPELPMDPGATGLGAGDRSAARGASARERVRAVGGLRVLTLTRPDGSRQVQVAETVEHRHAVLWSASAWLLGALVGVLPLTAMTLHLLLRRAFLALEPARTDLAARSAGDLRPVPLRDTPEELRPWLDTVNSLLDRVSLLVEGERAFAAQTAHELRTPLAAARAQAQRLSASSADEATRGHALSLVRQLDRLTRLASRLLQVARIESGVALRHEPLELSLLARLVADEFSLAHGDPPREGRPHIEVQGLPAAVMGDVDALGIAVRNLIDNALKHAVGATRIVVQVGHGTIGVVDDGQGVPPDKLAGLVRPFVRGDVISEGTGLGLSIVDTIAQRSGARLELRSPVDQGRGFSATLRFATVARDGA